MITTACGIYKITNIITGDYYIGSASNIRKRFGNHRNDLIANKHHNGHLQNAWNKYGKQAFEFTTILLCDIDTKLYYEQVLLDNLKPRYNIAICAQAPGQGLICSEETRHKLSEQATGINCSKETRRRRSEALIGNKLSLGYKHSEETNLKISEACKGRLNHQFGTPLSEETKRKKSEAMKGHTVSEETRHKLSDASKRMWAERKGNI